MSDPRDDLLRAIADGLDDPIYPENDGTREWCPRYSVYLRGNAAALLELPPDLMRKVLTRRTPYGKEVKHHAD